MPLYLELLSLDHMFHNSKTEPIILNDLPSKTAVDRDYFNNLVKETFTSDVVSVLPKCQCGDLKGEHLLGEVCDVCNTPVKQSIEDDISPLLWFRRPHPEGGQPVEKLINPMVWIMLDDRFTKSKFRIMNWLTDRNYAPAIKRPPIIDQMIADGIPRGYNNFVQNFDTILDYLFNVTDFKMKKSKIGFLLDMLEIKHPSQDPLQEVLTNYRHCIFSDYIPVLNRSLLVMEQNATGNYIDSSIVDIKDALNTMLSIDRDHFNQNPMAVENRTAKILSMLTDYYRNLFNKNLKPKEGLIRQHAHGARSNHAFRAVITSHEKVHDHDEIWIPWCVGVTVFQLHILNKLMRRDHPHGGYTHNEALGLLYSHVHKYHAGLDAILKELIASSPDPRGIPCLMQRNKCQSTSIRRLAGFPL